MKAARFHGAGRPLRVEEVPEPELRPGSVIVRVLSVFISPSLSKLLAKPGRYILPPTPFTPGMDTIGTVERVADDVAGLTPGELVYCDHYFESANVSSPPDNCFLGYFGIGAGSAAILERWPDGGCAERLMLPAECATPVGEAAFVAPSILCRLGWMGTAYAGLLRADFRPGATVLINGATGLVGSSGVLLALAMGAGRIVAMGRNTVVLDELRQLDDKRIVTVSTATEAGDAVIEAADGGADLLFDAVGDTDDPGSTVSAIRALRRGGAAAIVGGLTSPLPLSYVWLMGREITLRGSLWFPRRAAAEILATIACGALDLRVVQARTFPLERVNEAVAAAAERHSGLHHVALTP